MTDTYEYSNLANKYGNFHLPAVKILVGGADVLTSMNLLLEEISVTLSMTTASSVSFKIGGIYDKKNRSFKSGVADKFKPGTIVEIALGYYSSFVNIFKGFVYMLGAEFGEKELLVVTLMDVRKLMMISGKKHLLHNVKNYSDIFKTIMSNYARLCSVKMDATDDKLEVPVSQVGTDFDFVVDELRPQRKWQFGNFSWLYDKAYFRERPDSGAPLMKLEFGRELMELSMDYSYLDLNVVVEGFNAYEQKNFTAKAGRQNLRSPSRPYCHRHRAARSGADPDADSQEKVKKRASYIARSAVEDVKSGRLITIGLPEIVPGRFIEVVKLEKMVNKKYYISEVRHHLDTSFFTTEIEIGGWC